MDHPNLLLPSAPRFPLKGHTRSASRSPTRPRLIDDMLSDLSPATTLEAFTSASGTLKASIEAATPTERTFAIRAAVASKKIQEWVAELSTWPWPTRNSEGFEMPIAKRMKLSNGTRDEHLGGAEQAPRQNGRSVNDEEYWGSLLAQDVLRYESRIEEISEDMEDLNVEEIKSQVLDTHFSPKSRPSSSIGHYAEASFSQSYIRMDDLTAVVTATVLQALPSLSRLMTLMSVWSVRLAILHQISPLMSSMDDAEVALRSGWTAIQTQAPIAATDDSLSDTSVLSRQDYEIIRDVLQRKVSVLGQQLDQMLDSLEGRDDTLPEAWLDRMESIERDYGEWVVGGEGKVREGEWALEMSKRQQKSPRNSMPAAIEIDTSSSDTQSGELVPGHQGDNMAVETHSTNAQSAHVPAFETTIVRHASSTEPTDFPLALVEPLRKYSELAQSDGDKETNTPVQISKDAIPSEHNFSEPKIAEETKQRDERDEQVDLPLIESVSPPTPDIQNVVMDKFPIREEAVTDLFTLSDGASDGIVSSEETLNSSSLRQISVGPGHEIKEVGSDENKRNDLEIPDATLLATPQHTLKTMTVLESTESVPTPRRPTTPPRYSNGVTPELGTPTNDYSQEILSTPDSSKIPRFGHPLANSLRKEMSPGVSPGLECRNHLESDHGNNVSGTQNTAAVFEANATRNLQTPEATTSQDIESQIHKQDVADTLSSSRSHTTEVAKPLESSPSKPKPPRIDLRLPLQTSISEIEVLENASPELHSPNTGKNHHRGPSSASVISGYATSEPSPVIYEAEPTEYFRPVSPPVIYNAETPDLSDVATPTRTSFSRRHSTPKPQTPIKSSRESGVSSPDSMMERNRMSTDSVGDHFVTKTSGDKSPETTSHERTASGSSAESILRMDSGHAGTSRVGSVSPDISSTISERLYSANATPVRISSPEKDNTPYSSSTGRSSSVYLNDYEEESPTMGRFKLQNDLINRSPASSPPLESPISDRRPLPLHKTASFDPDSFYLDSPSTPGDPPSLRNVEVSPMPAISTSSKHSDDQLQQQISEILESIPARIRLASEPDQAGTSGVKQIKKRISLNPFSRPSSRAASRAPTPSFTLAPAQPKNPRPRPQNSNPEIKLYHLSRSTGEAPIKLFVRLVGESGERVMVRVGGGWADLGEYLKEYASHHGRRSDQAGKVEIQDMPPRVVSAGSTSSMFTLRKGNGKSSEQSSPISGPDSRPGSAFGRPLSSLAIRKTRKSVGEEAREKSFRSPSTPLPHALRNSPSVPRQSETPPSAASGRSVSSMSWREEESSLGLAGPRSRKGEISAENAAWVESMKEKVRIASAEKEKKEKVTPKAGFGELGQVGATKRLFKKSG